MTASGPRDQPPAQRHGTERPSLPLSGSWRAFTPASACTGRREMTIPRISPGIGLLHAAARVPLFSIIRSSSSARIDPSCLPHWQTAVSLLGALPRRSGPITREHPMSPGAKAVGGTLLVSWATTIGKRMLPQHGQERAAASFVEASALPAASAMPTLVRRVVGAASIFDLARSRLRLTDGSPVSPVAAAQINTTVVGELIRAWLHP